MSKEKPSMQIAQTVRLYGVHRSAASCAVTGSVDDKLAIIPPKKDDHGGHGGDLKLPDYALSSAIKAWYKTGTCGCFCGFERWRATRCNFKRGSARPSLLFFMEQRISAGRR